MRCGCPQCKTYMVQAEGIAPACACPDCGYRCNACMGTNTVLNREDIAGAAEALALRIRQAAENEESDDMEDF